MKRRAFLAAGATVTLAGCGGIVGSGNGGGGGSSGIETLSVTTLDAPGSEAGEMSVPADGQPTVVDLFATWCAPCKPTINNLAQAREQIDSDVQFVSVSNEPLTGDFTTDDIVGWWEDFGGPWTVAHAGNGTLRHFDAQRLPTSMLFGGDRVEVWRHAGVPKTSTVVEKINSL